MHFTGKEIRQAEAFNVEREWLQEQFFLSCETERRKGIDFELDLDGSGRMNSKTELPGIALQKSRFDT